MADDSSKLLLHTYFRSSSSARLRIALRLKGIDAEYSFVHLLKGEQNSDQHRALNPSQSVPVLSGFKDQEKFSITQSVAALEYLEENYPNRRQLLPSPDDPLARARVRILVNIIACDIQPVTNLRILQHIEELGGSRKEWSKKYMSQGLAAYEQIVKGTAGKYSVGDQITLADVCLAPALWQAERFEVDLTEFHTISRIYDELSKEKAVIEAHWRNQPDTPADLATSYK